jgi:uncharacterized protein (TIGR02231 family)
VSEKRIEAVPRPGSATPLEAKLVEVLVMEDRAQVLRRLAVELPAGRATLRLGPLTPLLADRTVRCRLRPASAGGPAGRVLDWRVTREYVVRTSRPEAEREIAAKLQAAELEFLAAHDRAAVQFQERARVASALAELGRHAGERLSVGAFDPVWGEELERAFARRTELEEGLLDLQWDQDDRWAHIQRLLEARRAAVLPVSEYRAELAVDVESEVRVEALVELEYQVPCALWRPAYQAELASDGRGLAWSSAGMVWQRSGEDWREVALSFSTARPSLGAELPLLEDDRLTTREKTDQEKKVVEVTSRDQVIARTSSAQDEARATADTPPGLDDGGEARVFRVPGLVSVPSDGRPHRLEFDSWRAEADSELVCLPERAAFVFLRSLQTYRGAQPLLAGPVDLVRDGGPVGRGSIRFVAPGERFALSWGSEDGLVVFRTHRREYEETGLRKRRQHEFHVKVMLANQTLEPKKLKLTERLPVSELEAVEVELDARRSTPGFVKDAQGLLAWELELPPGGARDVELTFRVSMPHGVVWNG